MVRPSLFLKLLRKWLRGLDSNQDNQLQRLACYQLHYPGNGEPKKYSESADIAPFFLHAPQHLQAGDFL